MKGLGWTPERDSAWPLSFMGASQVRSLASASAYVSTYVSSHGRLTDMEDEKAHVMLKGRFVFIIIAKGTEYVKVQSWYVLNSHHVEKKRPRIPLI